MSGQSPIFSSVRRSLNDELLEAYKLIEDNTDSLVDPSFSADLSCASFDSSFRSQALDYVSRGFS